LPEAFDAIAILVEENTEQSATPDAVQNEQPSTTHGHSQEFPWNFLDVSGILART
jgi:hypothetical protein